MEGWISKNMAEKNMKEQIVKSVNSIKNKIRMIKNEEDSENLKFQKIFKPITDPLKTLTHLGEKDDNYSAFNKSFESDDSTGGLTSFLHYKDAPNSNKSSSDEDSEYYDYANDDNFDDMGSNEETNDITLMSLKKEDVIDIYDNINVPFGIRSENKKLMMGDSIVHFSTSKGTSGREKSYVVTIKNKNYDLTPGLRELLMRNKPDLKLVTENDKINYKDMLDKTNAHKRDFHPNGQIKGDKGSKYRLIIKPLITQTYKQSDEKKIGGNLPTLKSYKSNTDYIYWDDANELIERLKLLIASKTAGNSNHDNEIISIIEELREAGIIKE